jgi:hydroxypyruvate reductase
MASAAARLLEGRLRGGVVIAPSAVAVPSPLDHVVGGHPVPTGSSEEAGKRAMSVAAGIGGAPESGPGAGRLLVLLSGGASSLMARPAEGVTLADKRRTTERLLREGTEIHELNAVRKHLSAIKGGWLAASSSVPCVTLAISDVLDDDLSVIGSGPTVPDETTFQDALDVLGRSGHPEGYPDAVLAHLKGGACGEVPETPKKGDPRLSRGEALVVGGRRDAMRGAAEEARRCGYHVVSFDQPVVGEARDGGRSLAMRVAALAAVAERPLCVIASGETTVNVTGPGTGGRNQELVLAAAGALPMVGPCAAMASVGTDGVDGPTDAAGAVADSTTIERAEHAGLNPERFLAENNAYRFFDALGDLIRTGPTGTNVGDIQVFLIA